MSNFNEDRRQGCVDFKYEPYRDNWKDKKIYIYIKYKDFWDGGGGGGWGSCYNYCNCSNYRHVVPIKCFRDRVRRFIVNVLTIH